MDCSGSSQVENATGVLPCLRREKRSSSAAATVTPSTTSAAAGSWKTALSPRTFTGPALSGRTTAENQLVTSGTKLAAGRARAAADPSACVLGHRPQPFEGPPDQPGNVHLGDADALGDLGLRQVLHEAEVEHDAVARGQGRERRGDRGAVLDELEAVVLDADRLRVCLPVPVV